MSGFTFGKFALGTPVPSGLIDDADAELGHIAVQYRTKANVPKVKHDTEPKKDSLLCVARLKAVALNLDASFIGQLSRDLCL